MEIIQTDNISRNTRSVFILVGAEGFEPPTLSV